MEEFIELGLTKNELKVYETLIKFGKLGSGELSGKSEVPYGRIYSVLESLISKGFVKLIPGDSKKFVPADPIAIEKIIQEKEKSLSILKEKVKDMKQFYTATSSDAVTLAFGKKGFNQIVEEIKQEKEYSYSIKWSSDYNEEKGKKRKGNIKSGIEFKDLVRYDKETEKNVKDWKKVSPNIKKINNEGIALSITDDEEVMIGLIKSNTTLLIKDKPFAKLMKKMFEETYKNAEEIGG